MTNNKQKSLSEILTEAVELRGLTIERLAILTDIPERYLAALKDGDFKKLPPAPYLRGYLMKIGEVLNIDGRALWQVYKNEHPVKVSGIEDKMPQNRFAIKPLNKKNIILLILGIAIILYVLFRAPEFLGAPGIQIINPATNNLITQFPSIKLIGEINPKDKLMINGEEIFAGESGRFEKEFPLQPGINAIEFSVKRFLGRETRVVRQIIYQPQ